MTEKSTSQNNPESWIGFDEKPDTNSATFENQRDAADYVAAIVMELRMIAHNAGLEKIVPPLEKAYYEAFSACRQLQSAGKSVPKPNPDRSGDQ